MIHVHFRCQSALAGHRTGTKRSYLDHRLLYYKYGVLSLLLYSRKLTWYGVIKLVLSYTHEGETELGDENLLVTLE